VLSGFDAGGGLDVQALAQGDLVQVLAAGVHHNQADVAERIRLVSAEGEVEVVGNPPEIRQHNSSQHMTSLNARSPNPLHLVLFCPIRPGIIHCDHLPTKLVIDIIHSGHLLRDHKVPIQRLQVVGRFIEAVPVIDVFDLSEQHFVVGPDHHLDLDVVEVADCHDHVD
jgi:hypothetical protein